MHLQMKTNRQAIIQYPVGQPGRIKSRNNRAEQDSMAYVRQSVFSDKASCPFVVPAINYDELDLVMEPESADIGHVHGVVHAASWCLDVHNCHGFGRDYRNVATAVGFHQNRLELCPVHACSEGVKARLEQWFATGDFGNRGFAGAERLDEIRNPPGFARNARLRCVAVSAAKIASSQTYKET